MSRRAVSKNDREVIRTLIEEGKSNGEIAEFLGFTKPTIVRWRRILGYEPYQKPCQSKYDYKHICEFVETGKSMYEISKICNVSIDTVSRWIKKAGLSNVYERSRPESPPKRHHEDVGFNADRHLCKTCRFRNQRGTGCDYYCVVGKTRNCKPEVCDKYEKEN